MLINRFVWIWRGLKVRPVAMLANLLALSLGLASFSVALAALLFLQGSDRALPGFERIFVITQQAVQRGGFSTGIYPLTSPPVAAYLKAEATEIDAVTRTRDAAAVAVEIDGHHHFLRATFVDASFSSVFPLPFLAGDPARAFAGGHGAVLAEPAARRLFGDTNPLGRRIRVGDQEVEVTGVLAPIAPPSIFALSSAADILVTEDVGQLIAPLPPEPDAWHGMGTLTAVRLAAGMSRDALSRRLAGFADRHVKLPRDDFTMSFGMIPLSRFPQAVIDGIIRADRTGVGIDALLLLIGSIVLAVATLNYANLSAAQAETRLRESGMHQLLGAGRGDIVLQTMLESLLLAVMAAILVLLAVPLLGMPLRRAVGLDLPALLFGRPLFWASLGAAVLAAALAGGLFPAILLSGRRAIEAARAGAAGSGRRRLAGTLIVAQFMMASFLIVMAAVMSAENTSFTHNIGTDEGISLAVITTPLSPMHLKLADLRAVLRPVPGVLSVSAVDLIPWEMAGSTGTLTIDAAGAGLTYFMNYVEDDYFQAIGARLLAGRALASQRGGDLTDHQIIENLQPVNIVIDRSLAQAMGWGPDEAVGRIIYREGQAGRGPMVIVGVIENRAQHFLSAGGQGNLYMLRQDDDLHPIVRIDGRDPAAVIGRIAAALDGLGAAQAVEIRTAWGLFQEHGKMFLRVARVFTWLTAFALAIAVLGLLGMAVHTVHRRTREIAIRKILGAGIPGLIRLLLWDLSRPILVAVLISWPLAYLAAQAYLNLFTQRIALSPIFFALSLALLPGVAWGAVGWRILNAARRDPATVLRHD